jgi:membrane protease subunit HflC
MIQSKLLSLIVGVFGLIFLSGEICFIVGEREKALVLQLGEAVEVYDQPGLKFKIPFIQDVIRYDGRLLDYSLPVIEVTAGDQKRVVVDMYTRYRIHDALLFYKKVVNNKAAQTRMSTLVDASMRRVIGRIPLSDMLSANRQKIMELILNEVRQTATQFGVEVVDVRIIRFDLPRENSQAIFSRMASERRQEAKQFRAEGDQKAQEIRAAADRETTILLAEARKTAEIKRGEGDGEAAKIYADAYNKDKDFYAFYRSLEVYRETLKSGDTTYVLSPDSELFKYFSGVR